MNSFTLFPDYQGNIIKVLSLLEPWASLVGILKVKHIETRSWSREYRGLLGIHASKNLLPKKELDYIFTTNKEIWKAFYNHFGKDPLEMGYKNIFQSGKIIAVGNLSDIWRITDFNTPPEPEKSFGDYTPGRFAWQLEDIETLKKPIEVKGQLGLWNYKIA